MAAFVQAQQGTGGEDTATSTAMNTTSGNLLVIGVVWFGSGTTFVSLTDTFSNSPVQIGSQRDYGGGFMHERLYYKENCTGGSSHTFTLTVSAGDAFPTVIVSEFSGVNTASSLDQQTSATGNSTSPSSGATSTRDTAAEVLIGWVTTGDVGANDVTAGTNVAWTLPANAEQSNGSVACIGAMEYFIASSAGTDAATFTLAGAQDWSCAIATFRASGGGGGGGGGTMGFITNNLRPNAFVPGLAR